jgi:hypothetical protein
MIFDFALVFAGFVLGVTFASWLSHVPGEVKAVEQELIDKIKGTSAKK